jgi:S1-C subfamily serine protease/Tfp pilus assembly protein PilF
MVIGLAAEADGAGLILESDPNYPSDEIVRAIPFRAERVRGPNDQGYKRYFTGNAGNSLSIDTRFIVEVVTFPDVEEFQNITSESSLDTLILKKSELEAVAARTPQARLYVRDVIASLEAQIKNFRFGQRKVRGKWLTAADYGKFQLTFDGKHYDNIELVSAEDKSAWFRYTGQKRIAIREPDGRRHPPQVAIRYGDDHQQIAHVDLERLTPDQIGALNQTSQRVQINPDWRQIADQVAEEAAKKEANERAAAELERLHRLEEEKQSALAQAHDMEDAARYGEALDLYKKYGAQDAVRRVSQSLQKLAVESEKKGEFGTAAEYFEVAGAFVEAGRVRRAHDLSHAAKPEELTDTEIFKRAAPAVVAVAVKTDRGEGHGSGFFVRSGGYLITNNHVVEGAMDITIIDAHGQRHAAKIIARMQTPDLALLKAELANHDVLALGDSSKLQPGDHVVAIGFPILKDQSAIMNQGVISSIDRMFDGNSVFQIDATINHGSSGGPLLDDRGEVVGITTFGLGDLGVDRFNFAIKINEARALIERPSEISSVPQGTTMPALRDSPQAWRPRAESDTGAVENKRGAANTSYDVGRIYFQQKKLREAIPPLQQAVAINPGFAEAWFLLGTSYRLLTDHANAAESLQRYVGLKSEDPSGWFILGLSERDLRHFGAAAQAFERCTKLAPADADGWEELARCYWRLNKFSDATVALQRAISIKPNDANLWELLTAVYRDSGQTEKAFAAFQTYQAISSR